MDYLTALAILALLRFTLYFVPTPGGSGVGEITIAALMSTVMPTHLLPIYTVLYRAFHLFLPATFGGWVLISELRSADNPVSGQSPPTRGRDSRPVGAPTPGGRPR